MNVLRAEYSFTLQHRVYYTIVISMPGFLSIYFIFITYLEYQLWCLLGGICRAFSVVCSTCGD